MIVKSILDTDLYKFTTSYAYMKLFPQARGTFEFFDRDLTEYPEDFVQKVYLELSNLGMLRLTNSELDYMTSNCRFVPQVYWEWLYSFRFNSGKVQVWLDDKKHLHITVTDYLYKVTLYEVPILAIISELRNRVLGNNCDMSEVIKKLEPKLRLSNVAGIKFSEFGTRRRFSYNVQDEVVSAIKEGSIYCTGTSNCYLAMKYEMPSRTPIANGNLQARCRMMYLYDIASRHKGLVMSTDNQTEYQLGFWTIHGDVGDFDPIQDLWKTEVYGLANYLRDRYKSKALEALHNDYKETCDKYRAMSYAVYSSCKLIPTDGLGISNSDLEQIGAKSYDEVDDILSRYIPFKEYRQKHGEDVVNKVWSRHLASEFKRKKAPIYISRELYE